MYHIYTSVEVRLSAFRCKQDAICAACESFRRFGALSVDARLAPKNDLMSFVFTFFFFIGFSSFSSSSLSLNIRYKGKTSQYVHFSDRNNVSERQYCSRLTTPPPRHVCPSKSLWFPMKTLQMSDIQTTRHSFVPSTFLCSDHLDIHSLCLL